MFFMMSPYFQQLLWINATGITAKGIKAAKLKRLSLSVPPYEEQGRIVQSLEKLLEYCGQLEIDLSKAQLFAGQIAVAFIEAITGIRIEEKEKMKPPKTELVSTLRVGTSPTTNDQAPLTIILIKNSNVLSAKALWNISGLEIDDFYQQLKIEMAKGWIVQPEIAYMKEVESS
jgi:type I restriction enzyme S subunit